MDRKLIDYLPDVVRDFAEFQGITTGEQPEFELAWNTANDLLENQFILTAGNLGISRWEQILHITPKVTDTLDIRRARILGMWGINQPYTITWLRNWITSIYGPTGHEETVTDYTINLQFDLTVLPNAEQLATEILKMLDPVRPSNMLIALDKLLQSYGTISYGAYSETSNEIEVWPQT